MRQAILIEADKTIMESASSYLSDGKWRLECDCSETTFLVNDTLTPPFMDVKGGMQLKINITKRGPKDRINIFAVRI